MHVAITGASSGIGWALAKEFAGAGYAVSMIARRGDLLAKLALEIGAEAKTHIAVQDLADRSQATAWIPEAEKALGPIDVLINNAGVQLIGHFCEHPLERLEALLDLNLVTPFRITRAVLPGMLARRSGTIVDIASMAALAPTPFMHYYNASKGGLAAGSESLRGELLG